MYKGLALVGLLLCNGVQALEPHEIRAVGLMKNQAVLQIGNQQRILTAGKTSPEGVKLIDSNSRSATIQLEGKTYQLTLSRATSSGGYQVPEKPQVSIARTSQGQYLTQGSINGRPVQFLVDTGATSVAMNSVHARNLGIDFANGTPTQVVTAGGIANSYQVVLDEVNVGGIRVKSVAANVVEGQFPVQILLGMTYLKHVKLADHNGLMTLTVP